MFLTQSWDPPRGTTACETDATSPACITCGTPACTAAGSACTDDPNCKLGDCSDVNEPCYYLPLRLTFAMQTYGLNPQFPMTRYYVGLTSPKVPNRNDEYPSATSSYNTDSASYACTNPLFAATLPAASDVPDATATTPAEVNTTLCALPVSTARSAGDVFYLHIGGVPHELVQSTPGGSDGLCPAGTAAADCPQRSTLDASDWVKILGQGPAGYSATNPVVSLDYRGISPYMIESITPRNTLGSLYPSANPPVTTLSAAMFPAGGNPAPDPVNGREWTTSAGRHLRPVDLEYACIFQLPPAIQRDCAATPGDTIEGNSCECPAGMNDAGLPAPPETRTTRCRRCVP